MEALKKTIIVRVSNGETIERIRDKVEIALLREENKRLQIEIMHLEDTLAHVAKAVRLYV